MHKRIAGIDYGAKLAGTTVVAWNDDEQLLWEGTSKKQDADKWLIEHLTAIRPDLVFMDAPLSLPGVYSGNGEDYFYREGDKALRAMSPMFLGGLTARAMQLKNILEKKGIEVFETYPARIVQELGELDEHYLKKSKTSLPGFLNQLDHHLPLKLEKLPQTWHGADALLAWMGGYRYVSGRARKFGNEKEGIIWI